MKLTSSLCQFLQNWARNRALFQTKPDSRELLFDAWSGPRKPPIGCLRFSLRDGRLCATNLGEKKANVKRKAQSNAQNRTRESQRFKVARRINVFAPARPGMIFCPASFLN